MKANIKVTIYRGGAVDNGIKYSKEFSNASGAASYILRHKPQDTRKYMDRVEVVGASIFDKAATARVRKVRQLVEMAEKANVV